MTKEEKQAKQAKIAEVRANLDSDLQTLFDAYTSVSNPQLKKKLEDNNTDWREVLTKWQANKEKKAKEPKAKTTKKRWYQSYFDNIANEIANRPTNKNFQSAIEVCKELLGQLEKRQTEKAIKSIPELEQQEKALQEEIKRLKELQRK